MPIPSIKLTPQEQHMYKPVNYQIVKSVESSINKEELQNLPFALSIASIGNFEEFDKLNDVVKKLREKGIKSVQNCFNLLKISTDNDVLITTDNPVSISREAANILVYNELLKKSSIYGIGSFKECLDDVNRFDILKKGLRLDSNKLLFLPDLIKEKVTNNMSVKLQKNIRPKDVFYISNEVYYYDKAEKTVYSTNIVKTDMTDKDINVCKFIQDSEGNTIGYETNKYDIVRNDVVKSSYIEQQEPESTLPACADFDNYKEFALACRFGNYKVGEAYADAADKIIKTLDKNGIKTSSDKLQGTRYTRNGSRKLLITYFNPKNGKTIAFDKNGDYVCHIEYIKNNDGKIENYYTI